GSSGTRVGPDARSTARPSRRLHLEGAGAGDVGRLDRRSRLESERAGGARRIVYRLPVGLPRTGACPDGRRRTRSRLSDAGKLPLRGAMYAEMTPGLESRASLSEPTRSREGR